MHKSHWVIGAEGKRYTQFEQHVLMHVKIHRIIGIKKKYQGKIICFVLKPRGIYILDLTLGAHLLFSRMAKFI